MKSPSSKNQDELNKKLIDQIDRSAFFHQQLHEHGLLEIAYVLENIQGQNFTWDLETLGISQQAWKNVIHQGIKPIQVFAHPYVLIKIEQSVSYYRGLAMVPLKSTHKTKISTENFKEGENKYLLNERKAWAIAHRLNELISRLVETDEHLDPRELDIWRGMTLGAAAHRLWQRKRREVQKRQEG